MSTNKQTKWEPDKFEIETNSIWSFPERGSWATHNPKYRGNWTPYIPRNLILRYTNEDDIILDQFIGSGTTLIESKLLNRRGIGVDINPEAIKITKDNTNFEYKGSGKIRLYNADARKLSFIPDNYIDLICTHPPYGNIIKYSTGLKGDLSNYNIDEFFKQMIKVATESYRVLKNGKYCAILMGDTRIKGNIIPLSFEVMKIFENVGFTIKEIIIKEQHNCKSTEFWEKRSINHNFILIAHEYLFIFKK